MKRKPYVFGVGLPRTGTTSLAEALCVLGWDTLHGVRQMLRGVYAYVVHGDDNGIRTFRMNDWEGWVCWPIFAYRTFWQYYPDAVWVQTVRDPEQWGERYYECVREDARLINKGLVTIRSSRRHVEVLQHMRHFGYHYASERALTVGAAKLQTAVRKFFRHKRRVRFVQLDVFSGDGWGRLCEALDVEEPATPFPHLNARGSQ